MRRIAKVFYGTIAHQALPDGINISGEACIEYTGKILEGFHGTDDSFKNQLKSSTNVNVLEDMFLLEAAEKTAKEKKGKDRAKNEEVDDEVDGIVKDAANGKSIVSKINNAVISTIKKDKKRDEQKKEKDDKIKEKINPTEDKTDETITESANVILEGLKLDAFKSKIPGEEAKPAIITAYTILETLVTMGVIENNHLDIIETVCDDREINNLVEEIKAPMLTNNLVESTIKTVCHNDKFRVFKTLITKRVPLNDEIMEAMVIESGFEDKLKVCNSLLFTHATPENIKYINEMRSSIVEAAEAASKDNGSTFGVIPGIDKENSISSILNLVEAATNTNVSTKVKLSYVRNGLKPYSTKMAEVKPMEIKSKVNVMPPKEKKDAILDEINKIVVIMKEANATQKKLLTQYGALKEILGTSELVKIHRAGVNKAKRLLRIDPTISIKTNRTVMGKLEKAITTGVTTSVKAKLSPNVPTIMK